MLATTPKSKKHVNFVLNFVNFSLNPFAAPSNFWLFPPFPKRSCFQPLPQKFGKKKLALLVVFCEPYGSASFSLAEVAPAN